MDPISIATAAVAALSPYLIKTGERVAGAAGDAAFECAQALFAKLKLRFADQRTAQVALQDLADDPKDADNAAGLRKELKKLLAADPDFQQELADLIAAAPRSNGPVFTNHIGGDVGNWVQSGSIGQLHIGPKP